MESLACAALVGLLAGGGAEPPGGGAVPEALLAPGVPRAAGLAAGEVQAWQVELRPGTAFAVAVEQRGIDVAVAVRGPDGGERAAVDSPLDRQGTEWLLVVPDAAGVYRIEVRAREPGAPPPGRYQVRIDPLEPGARRDAVAALTEAGRLYLAGTAEARRRALPLYRRARGLLHDAGDRRGEAQALYEAAVVARLVDEARAAGEEARAALALWEALGNGGFAAAAANEAGLDSWLAGEREAAGAAFGRALALAEAAGDGYGAAVAQSNLCLMALGRGELRQGAACYDGVVPRLEAVGADELLASALTSAGRAYDALSEPDEARTRFMRALGRQRATGNRAGEARTLNSLGVLAADAGDFEDALARQGEALAIFQALDERRWQARVVSNVGVVYHATGAYRQAQAAYEQALALSRAVGDRAGQGATLIDLGLVHGRLGEVREALELNRQALATERGLGDRRGLGIALTQLGRTETEAGDPAAGLAHLDEAVALFAAMGDRRNHADALRNQGEARAALGDGAGALASFRQALAAARTARHLPGEALALYALAEAEHRAGDAAAAREHAAAALAAIEALRTRIGDPDLKASFAALIHRAYELDIQLLMEAHRADPAGGHDRAALAVAERARARALLDLLGAAGVRLDVPDSDITHDSRDAHDSDVARDAHAPDVARDSRDSHDSDTAGVAALAARRDALARRLSAAADTDRQDVLRQLDLVEAEIRARSPAYAALTAPRPLDAAGVQALLDPDTLLLVYSLGETRGYLWAVTRESVRAAELPARAAVEGPARRLHELWSAAAAGPAGRHAAADTAARLAAMLLGPVARELGARRLVVVPDGALCYLPFGALPRPGAPGEVLLDRHELAFLPSASALAVERQVVAARQPAARWLAVLADPVFARDDRRVPRVPRVPRVRRVPRVSRVGATAGAAAGSPAGAGEPVRPAGGRAGVGAGTLPRLPASREEAAAIAALVPAGEAMVALDFAASRQAVLGDRLRGYRVIHFATHAVLDAEHPALSGLALSQVGPDGLPRDGFLHLRDIYGLRLAADLVVLSGCRTALGREVRGEGLVGLARGFQYAGAARVVASLWRVEDRATAALMTRFYRALWTARLPPAAALRAAELSLRAERPYRDPFYWSGFVLLGDWR